MPNTTKTPLGKSWKERAALARQMTAEQQESARRSAAEKKTRRSERGAKRGAEKGAQRTRAKSRAKDSGKKKPTKTGASSSRFGLKVLAGVLGAVILCTFILYPVSQTYYQSLRKEQRLEAQLAAVSARNAVLQESNEALGTEEGVEARAREELGWVKKGERAAVVTNSGQAEVTEKIPGQVVADEVKAPETWYYNILDVIFFVER